MIISDSANKVSYKVDSCLLLYLEMSSFLWMSYEWILFIYQTVLKSGDTEQVISMIGVCNNTTAPVLSGSW